MNNSEAIKRKLIYDYVSSSRFMFPCVTEGCKCLFDPHGLTTYILTENDKARSEAFEEAIQALPEKKTLDQQAMEVLGNIGKLPLGYSRNIRNELLDEIKGILMQLKGKNG